MTRIAATRIAATRIATTHCGHSACAAVCLLLGASLTSTEVEAQPPRVAASHPMPVESMASVVIGAMFRLDPGQPLFSESATDRCQPLTCVRSTVMARSNHRWQLQVRALPLLSAPVSWLPLDGVALPLTSDWQSIASGPGPTSGTEVPLRLGVGGPMSQRPAAERLSTLLEFRMVPLP